MTRVKTTDARTALTGVMQEKIAEAAGSNDLLSRTEEKKLDPFLGQAAGEVRTNAGPGARLHVDQVVTQAGTNADAIWAKHNPPGRAGTYLSRADVAAIEREDPNLGALTRLALLRATQGQGNAGAKEAVDRFFSAFDFHADPNTGERPMHNPLPGGGEVIDLRPQFAAQNRRGVPKDVLAGFDFYDRGNAWSTCTAQKAKIEGHDVWVLYTSGDGDDAYLEVYDKKGKPLTSGRIFGEELVGLDEVFGRCRFSVNLVALDKPKGVEGLQDPAARVAAGQIPADWQGDVQLNQGRLEYNHWARLGHIDVPALAGSPREELGLAAFEYLWDKSLRMRRQNAPNAEPFLLGPQREGTMNLGTFTRPDGKTFEVAQWKDIDDGSFTLYFTRTASRLKLAIEEFDN